MMLTDTLDRNAAIRAYATSVGMDVSDVLSNSGYEDTTVVAND